MEQQKKEHTANFNEPMRGVQWLMPEQCKDCIFRDKTMATIDGKVVPVGATRYTCHIYESPNRKPNEVMKNKGDCDYYEKE